MCKQHQVHSTWKGSTKIEICLYISLYLVQWSLSTQKALIWGDTIVLVHQSSSFCWCAIHPFFESRDPFEPMTLIHVFAIHLSWADDVTSQPPWYVISSRCPIHPVDLSRWWLYQNNAVPCVGCITKLLFSQLSPKSVNVSLIFKLSAQD